MKVNKRHALAATAAAVLVATGTTFGVAYAATAPANTDYDASINSANYSGGPKIKLHKPTALENYVQAQAIPVDKLGTAGCEQGYGNASKCLPHDPPAAVAMGHTAAEMPWNCGLVRLSFPKGIKVTNPGQVGSDPLGLDTNHNGVACDRGDT